MVHTNSLRDSLWLDGLDPGREPALPSLPATTDVAVVGGGYTGLWTAYYLKRADPSLDITVLEAETAGFGASGRNGGWCLGTAWGVDALLENPATRSRGLLLQRALFDTVDEVGRVCQAENIDCHYTRGGTLRVVLAPFRADVQRRELEARYRLGFTEDDYRWLDRNASHARLSIQPNHGATYFAHCATIQPARLVRGLADAVTRLGVRLLEHTPVTRILPGQVVTSRGAIAAERILRATEGYTATLAGLRRAMLPIYSMMVATAPLPDAMWQALGLHHRETFGDDRRMVIYGQRTMDGRLAFGGRAGYRFGSRRTDDIRFDSRDVQRVTRLLRELFPQLSGYPITHAWGGVLGVPRHWRPCVTFDRDCGLGWAGGYVGEGVAASNLAARTLADLVLEQATPLTELPWVDDVPPQWEPEPLRWLGARAIQFAGARADQVELQQNRPSRLWGRLFDALRS
jgi:glycine/D-amino acid oxidase-like deaminating enzyme